MKKIIFFICIFFLASLNAQNPNFQWAGRMGGPTFGQGRSTATDAAGNVFSTGFFQATVDFDPGPGIYNITSAGNWEVYVTKFDPNGNFVWAKSIAGPGADEAFGIATDASGNVIVTGYFTSHADFDPGPAVYQLNTLSSTEDIFILKLNSAGNFMWATNIGASLTDYGFAVTTDITGNVYTTGYFNGTADFDPGPAVYNLTSNNDDIFVSKLDAAGNYIWAKNKGSISSDYGYAIAVDANSNVYTTGYFQYTADFDPGIGVYNIASNGGQDVFISKLDINGNFVWAKSIGANPSEYGKGITIDNYGNIYTVGIFSSVVDFDPGPGVFNLSGFGYDNYLLKLDPAGNFVWVDKIGGSFVNGVVTDATGNIYTIGDFGNTTDFDPGPGVYNLIAASSGLTDVFISKINSLGNLVWAVGFGGTGTDEGYDVALDNFGNVFTTGNFDATPDFDPGPGVYTLTASSGSSDIYVHKMGQCNISVTTTAIGQTNLLCNGNAIGSATVAASGATGLSYLWMPVGGSSTIATGLNAGIYTCMISHTCGLGIPETFTITQPLALTSTTLVNSVLCFGNNNGAATIIATGGTGPYAYLWSTSSTATVISGLSPGVITLTVTDANNCVAFNTVTITQPTVLSVTASTSNTTICAGSSTTLTANVNGGTNPYNYTWSSSSTNSTCVVSPSNATIYTVTVHDINNCSDTKTVSISTNSVPIISVNNGTICSGNSFTILPGGANSYTYSGGSAIVSPLTNTNYTVTGTATNGCANTVISSVTVNALPTVSVNSGAICLGESFTITPTGANTYTITGGASVISPTTNLSYSVVGTDTNGCTSFNTAISSVTVNSLPIVSVNSGIICNGNNFTIIPSGANTYTISGGTAIVNPTVNSTYSVVGTDTNGCTSFNTAISSVTVNSLPIVSVNSGTICSGNNFTITPSGANTYTISGGISIVNPTVNSTYSVIGTDGNGCINSNATISSVTVNSLPIVNIISNNNLICVGHTASLVASGASTYVWNTSSTSTVIAVSPTINTTYTVTGTAANSCTNSVAFTQSVSSCTGIDSKAQQYSNIISVYPNPSNGLITAEFGFDGEKEITVTNSIGQIIMVVKTKNYSEVVDLKDYAKGIYFVKVMSGENSANYRMITE